MTDHITIPRALLEQWKQTVNTLAALSLKAERHEVGAKLKQSMADELAMPTRCDLCGYQYGHQIGCANNPVDIALSEQAIRAELAKPEQEESFIPDWANYRQGVADGKAGSPKWHDAPTCAGWWVRNSYEGIGVYSISEPSIKFLKGSAARWYGPICEDEAIAKAEGRTE